MVKGFLWGVSRWWPTQWRHRTSPDRALTRCECDPTVLTTATTWMHRDAGPPWGWLVPDLTPQWCWGWSGGLVGIWPRLPVRRRTSSGSSVTRAGRLLSTARTAPGPGPGGAAAGPSGIPGWRRERARGCHSCSTSFPGLEGPKTPLPPASSELRSHPEPRGTGRGG